MRPGNRPSSLWLMTATCTQDISTIGDHRVYGKLKLENKKDVIK